MTEDEQFSSIVLFPEIGQPTWVELIIATYTSPRTHFHRELVDPTAYATVRDLALVFGVYPTTAYTAYIRKLPTTNLDVLDWLTPLFTGLSVVVVPNNMPSDGFTRVQQGLAKLPGILPTRMIWPV